MDVSPFAGEDPDGPEEPSTVTTRLMGERAALVVRLERLSEDMSALVASSLDSNADDEHDPEGQTIAYERSQLAAVTRQLASHLADVEAALVRVADGTYGVCASCHSAIPAERLAARPTALTCVHHLPR